MGYHATPNTYGCFLGQLPGNHPWPQGPRLEEPSLTLTAGPAVHRSRRRRPGALEIVIRVNILVL